VRLYSCGTPREVLIDDFLPANTANEAVFARAKSSELWVSLLEKAIAKVYGGYWQLDQISECETLETLTGAPVLRIPISRHSDKSISRDEREALWSRVQHAIASAAIALVNCEREILYTKAYDNAYKLVGAHGYTVLDAREFNGTGGGGDARRFVLLRNAWADLGKFFFFASPLSWGLIFILRQVIYFFG
jgi:hypothetical protein